MQNVFFPPVIRADPELDLQTAQKVVSRMEQLGGQNFSNACRAIMETDSRFASAIDELCGAVPSFWNSNGERKQMSSNAYAERFREHKKRVAWRLEDRSEQRAERLLAYCDSVAQLAGNLLKSGKASVDNVAHGLMGKRILHQMEELAFPSFETAIDLEVGNIGPRVSHRWKTLGQAFPDSKFGSSNSTELHREVAKLHQGINSGELSILPFSVGNISYFRKFQIEPTARYTFAGYNYGFGFIYRDNFEEFGNKCRVGTNIILLDDQVLELIQKHNADDLLTHYRDFFLGSDGDFISPLHDDVHHLICPDNGRFRQPYGATPPIVTGGRAKPLEEWSSKITEEDSLARYEVWANKFQKDCVQQRFNSEPDQFYKVIEKTVDFIRRVNAFQQKIKLDTSLPEATRIETASRVAEYLTCSFLWGLYTMVSPDSEALSPVKQAIQELNLPPAQVRPNAWHSSVASMLTNLPTKETISLMIEAIQMGLVPELSLKQRLREELLLQREDFLLLFGIPKKPPSSISCSVTDLERYIVEPPVISKVSLFGKSLYVPNLKVPFPYLCAGGSDAICRELKQISESKLVEQADSRAGVRPGTAEARRIKRINDNLDYFLSTLMQFQGKDEKDELRKSFCGKVRDAIGRHSHAFDQRLHGVQHGLRQLKCESEGRELRDYDKIRMAVLTQTNGIFEAIHLDIPIKFGNAELGAIEIASSYLIAMEQAGPLYRHRLEQRQVQIRLRNRLRSFLGTGDKKNPANRVAYLFYETYDDYDKYVGPGPVDRDEARLLLAADHFKFVVQELSEFYVDDFYPDEIYNLHPRRFGMFCDAVDEFVMLFNAMDESELQTRGFDKKAVLEELEAAKREFKRLKELCAFTSSEPRN